MPVYKDKERNTWMVKTKYKDWQGDSKWLTRRGFRTKREALDWEREQKLFRTGNLGMTFENFVELYRLDRRVRLKESTFTTKDHIIDTKLIPYFGKMSVMEITPTDILRWQNELMAYRNPNTGRPYSKSYLRTVHNQISAIFNHAVRFYKLKENPAAIAGSMGSNKSTQTNCWTKEEYLQFAEYMMDDPKGYYAFQMLYWCGLREGEMMALEPGDFDFQKGTVSITKTFHQHGGKQYITEPNTPKSNRVVTMPAFLAQEMEEYLEMVGPLKEDKRVFPVSKTYLHNCMTKGSEAMGWKRIRIHDLRHSHVSLLIHMGYSAVAIADRLGHESIDITYRYAHLFPNIQEDMAGKLDALMEESYVS